MRKEKFFTIMSVFLLSLSACHFQSSASSPYVPSSSASPSGRVKVTDIVKNKSEGYALLLSPSENRLSQLDMATNRITLSIPTGKNPVALAVSPDKFRILVVNKLDGTISAYFREDNSNIQPLGATGSGDNPTDVIFNHKGTEAYVAYQGSGRISTWQILNRDKPKYKSTLLLKDETSNAQNVPYILAINDNDDALYALDKQNGKVFVYKKDNDQFKQDNIINLVTDSKLSLEDIKVFDNKLYISESNNGQVIVFDTKENKVTTKINLKNNDLGTDVLPSKMAINKDTQKMYVINQGSSTVAVVNLKDNTLIKHIQLATNSRTDSMEPSDIGISPDNAIIYVTSSAGRNLSIISPKEDKLIKNVGTTPSSGDIPPLSAIEVL